MAFFDRWERCFLVWHLRKEKRRVQPLCLLYQHQITLQVSDTDGFSSSDSTMIYINTPPPDAPVVSMTPSPVFSVDDVTVSITQPIDIDGDSISHSLSGYKEWLNHRLG